MDIHIAHIAANPRGACVSRMTQKKDAGWFPPTRERASLQQLEIIEHATALKARTCFALDGVENKRAAERGRERGRQLFVQVDPGTRNRVYPAIDPPSTWESFEAEARRTPAFATVTEQLATVTVRAQSVTQSGKKSPSAPGRPATGTCLHEEPVYRQS